MMDIMNLLAQLVHASTEMGYNHIRLQNLMSSRRSTSNTLMMIALINLSLLFVLWMHLADGHNNIVWRNPENRIWSTYNRS